MKDYIKEIIDPKLSRIENENKLKEYLQTYILYILYRKKFYLNLVFTGGTALRLIYKIRRFSEDLDFSLSAKAKGHDFHSMLKNINNEFTAAGYQIEVKYNTERNVINAFFKFSGLLYETGLSPLKGEKTSIKIEIDTNPPHGGIEEITLFRSVYMFYLHHYGISSLFAGKIHALLCRKFTKGRDWYDLLWYLTTFKGLEPNFVFLNNAMKQTYSNAEEITKDNWKDKLKDKIKLLDTNKVKNDVKNFMEDAAELQLLSTETFINLLK